ncbi:VOC family protein [Hymenobacter latericus]|uniref:VOC family protein n=1 Tax=Hymenobacter sp. YIM 151858-1 TaxID=2987688 RepID=UPI00222666B1|nr:VOC family protein [Hymenobacter sp. YIM 151858-1]UYZ58237.1 VOC family protein [Hymenobacter sp. YIM 151858-1]
MSAATLPYLSVPAERIGIHAPAGSLPAETRLGTVHLQVADLGRSLGFYQEVLGFRLLRQQAAAGPHGAVAHLGLATSDEALLLLHEKPGVRPVPRRGLLGIYHFAVLLPSRPDLGRFVRHVRQLGVPLGSSDHNYSEATYLVDPDGITVEVYRDRPRQEWQVTAQGEIQSALDPMDTHGVLAAAGAEPWAGLPAGTTLGHMHLYVGDLGQAAAFYHAALGLDKVT